MRLVPLAAIAVAGCGLFPDVGELARDAGADASVSDATDERAIVDAPADSPAASAPHVVAVWNAIDESTTFGTTLGVSVSNAAGDALVACVRETRSR